MTNRHRTQVVTYMATNGSAVYEINLTAVQAKMFRAANVWPRAWTGREYCQVAEGAHAGEPTWTDDDVQRMIADWNAWCA